ncbi:NAD(P)H dehydrogenase (quinone) [Hydrogenivirga caldilitoris]|uniref:NAD(P)H dehydrogenase (Quinone) n=1 Tax=Hydrogenivirga caldilitoris TaxID=246264 RepID=A0A497XNK2_9AQUI|nr:NAD(P)H-dependent oxidoreductase [Hydrogenivirga caldilitoris]RLJ70515.1 NAD(P)H dehydrogenase (quinone) [Hydrogenivirga caldilitoris]
MVLVIYAHPNPKSFNAAIRETVEDFLKERNLPFRTRDLYAISFNPVLSGEDFVALQKGSFLEDVGKEQEFVKEADTLIFIFPMWWYSFPAILKGYIDRVFSYGFAYGEKDGKVVGLLEGKRALIFCTLGGFEEDYENFSECLMNTFKATFEFCSIKVPLVKFFYGVPYVSDEVRKGYLEEVRRALLEAI